MKSTFLKGLFLITILSFGSLPVSFAQEVSGGVDVPGNWYPGKGLKQGDQFSYKLCHTHLDECKEIRMDFWVQGDIKSGTEDKWLLQAVVYDGNKIVKGTMELGKIAPEPTGGTPELAPYRSAFKSSIVWLSAFSTADNPKEFKQVSWGKIANIGGQQVRPTSIETISTQAGTFETVMVGWYTGGYTSKIWVKPDFPFPVKASTWTHVSSGIPPQEYRFDLLSFKSGVQTNPFVNIQGTLEKEKVLGCPQNYEFQSVRKQTKDFRYLVDLKYGPKNPIKGCTIEWIIDFRNQFNESEFLNQVQFDILVVDDKQKPIRSVAQDEGRPFLYSPSGQVRKSIVIEEGPGKVNYAIWVYGLSPEGVVPSTKPDFVVFEIPIVEKTGTTPTQTIPSWIKNNAGWWAEGKIGDSDFVLGIQYLIKEGIMKIPSTVPGSGTGSNEIPSWIKNNAGWWATGQIDDNSFVQGIQYLVKEGIIKLTK